MESKRTSPPVPAAWRPFVWACVLVVALALMAWAAGLGARGALRTALMIGASLVLAIGLVERWPRHRLGILAALSVWLVIWVLHLGVRGFLELRYGMQPNSLLVIQSVVNTTPAEVREYWQQAWPLGLASFAIMVVLSALAVGLARQMLLSCRTDAIGSTRPVALLTGLAVLGALHASGPNRKENPVVYWVNGVRALKAWERSVADLVANRSRQMARLPVWQPTYIGPTRSRTVVLLIGESTNRWNWSLYGYPRRTTPRLDGLRSELIVFRDVISSAGNTIPEIERMLTVATHDDGVTWRSEPTVPMLAGAAGYKVFWLSNQSDRYVNMVFGREAQVFTGLNLGGHRGDTSLDGALLPHLDAALADPARLKFIVVHLLGAHPHYELRYPPEFAKFNGASDSVRARLDKDGRFFWVRLNRDLYDNAMLYQDHIIAEMIGRVKARARPDEPAALIYVSDHGQEVGHMANTVGHAFKLESGFTVPLLLWTSMPLAVARRDLEARPYQTDKLDWTLLPLLGIRTAFDKPALDLLSPTFGAFPRVIDGKPYAPCAACPQVSPPQ